MAYEPYVTPEYYQKEYGGGIVPEEEENKIFIMNDGISDLQPDCGPGNFCVDRVPTGPDSRSGLSTGRF